MRKFKIVLLFWFILCAFSLGVFFISDLYYANRESEAVRSVNDFLKCFDTKKDCEIIGDNGAIGFIKIPSLNVEAPIFEGTDSEILKFSVRSF